jgi:hypothetical protein
MFKHLNMPSLGGATEWLKSPSQGERTFEIALLDPGVEVFAFTFG